MKTTDVKKIDPTIVAQVVAPYIFQKVVCDATSRHRGTGLNCDLKKVVGTFDAINRNVDIDQFIGVTYDNADGIEFLNVFGERCRMYQDFYKTENLKFLLKPVSMMKDDDLREVARMASFSNKTNMLSSGREFLSSRMLDLPWGIYQFLQLRGYDLPHQLLDNKTLYQAGLATYNI